MSPTTITQIDIKRFDVLTAYARIPPAAFTGEELAWFSDDEEKFLGVLLQDTENEDFSVAILCRDGNERFHCIDREASISDPEEAMAWMERTIAWHAWKASAEPRPSSGSKPIDLFSPIVPPDRLHPNFVSLSRDNHFSPARSVMREIMRHYIDIDGNFVEQFQSNGFHSRLWELYLFTYLSEQCFLIQRDHPSPDFVATKLHEVIAIEAVIVGRSESNPPKYLKEPPDQLAPANIKELQRDQIPIKFGSPLYSKLKRQYWKLPHVAGKPLVFAIADFHDDQSFLWTSFALVTYLYGIQYDFDIDEQGNFSASAHQVERHTTGSKSIPSGFFTQPEAENVSAVLFSACGTLAKFNRIGRQAGFKDPASTMIRAGFAQDPDLENPEPAYFMYEVDESCDETWAEGLVMYHNPSAKHPVPVELFPDIAHHFFSDGRIVSNFPDFHPHASLTYNISSEGQ